MRKYKLVNGDDEPRGKVKGNHETAAHTAAELRRRTGETIHIVYPGATFVPAAGGTVTDPRAGK